MANHLRICLEPQPGGPPWKGSLRECHSSKLTQYVYDLAVNKLTIKITDGRTNR